MRTNGASTSLRSPKVIASAVFVLALPFVTSCAYPIASNSPHLVGMRVSATRLSELVLSVLPMRLRRALRCFRNGTARAQTVDFGCVESQFLENLVVVLSDVRGALCRYLGDTMHLNRTADRRCQLAAGAFERDEDVIRSQLWIVDHLFRSEIGRAHV